MARIYGPHCWNEDVQTCTQHGFPQLPCEACLAEHHPEIRVSITHHDREMMASDPEWTIAGMLPANHQWLVERVV